MEWNVIRMAHKKKWEEQSGNLLLLLFDFQLVAALGCRADTAHLGILAIGLQLLILLLLIVVQRVPIVVLRCRLHILIIICAAQLTAIELVVLIILFRLLLLLLLQIALVRAAVVVAVAAGTAAAVVVGAAVVVIVGSSQRCGLSERLIDLLLVETRLQSHYVLTLHLQMLLELMDLYQVSLLQGAQALQLIQQCFNLQGKKKKRCECV